MSNYKLGVCSIKVAGHPHKTRAGLSLSGLVWIAVSFAVIALATWLVRQDRTENWPAVPGEIVSERVLPVPVIQAKWQGVEWRADFAVSYFVNGREYYSHVDSGVQGESEDSVRTALTRISRSCTVRYNPNRASESIAECR